MELSNSLSFIPPVIFLQMFLLFLKKMLFVSNSDTDIANGVSQYVFSHMLRETVRQ